MNAAMRQGKYSEDLWKQSAGKTADELGEEWKANLDLLKFYETLKQQRFSHFLAIQTAFLAIFGLLAREAIGVCGSGSGPMARNDATITLRNIATWPSAEQTSSEERRERGPER